MMRRLLGLVFNRWVLAALLLAALLAVLWTIGPLVAVGEWRPLETDRALWITTAIVVLLAVAVVGWILWRARRGNRQVVAQLVAQPASEPAESADLKAVRERFEAALGALREARFADAGRGIAGWIGRKLDGRYLYQLPWYLIVGAPGSGKTVALRNAGLRFPLAEAAGAAGAEAVRGVGGTRHCDWWFTDQAVLIDTAGRFFTQDSDAGNEQATWGGFLGLLKRARPRQPLNGVLVVVSATDLVSAGAADRARLAQAARQRVQELHQRLGTRLPIYLMVTKCDLLAGFGETFAGLEREARNTPWGMTFARDDAQAWTKVWEPEFDALLHRLDQGLVDRLQAEPDAARRARIYSFPSQFAQVKAPLAEFLTQVFAPSRFEADPLLRGIYFVSGTQEGSPIDRVLGTLARRYRLEGALLPPQAASGRSFFLQRLLTDVVFAEHGIAGTDSRWERRRGALALAGYAAVALVCVALIAAWTTSYRSNSAYIDAVSARVETVRRQVQETPNRASSDLLPLLGALDAVRGLAAADGAAAPDDGVPWTLGFGLYQGKKLDGAAHTAYQRMLVDAVLPRLALRIEEQLRSGDAAESQYEALKAYLMLYDPSHFEPAALKTHIEADWDSSRRELTAAQREALSRHLDALLAQGAAVSPLPQDQALVAAVRTRLAAVPLPQRVYDRMRRQGLGAEYPEFSVVRAGGGNAPLVFTRASGRPLARGVPGLFSYDGYHKGFQSVVDDAARQLAAEQPWVLGINAEPAVAIGPGARTVSTAAGRLIDDVRRLYLVEYRDTWKAFIADVRLQPLTSIAQSLEKTRFLAAPDSPLIPLLRAMSRETTLLRAGTPTARVEEGVRALRSKAAQIVGAGAAAAPTTGAPGERLESIVDDEFAGLRRMVTAPEGGKAPIEGVVARLAELQQLLTAVDAALKGGGAPPPSPLPNQLKVEAANAPEPVRSLLDSLGSTSSRVALMQLRESLSREVRAQVGEFCQQAVAGRYPFDPAASREVTQADFAALFGPGGKFEQMQTRLAPYVDTSKRPWAFRPVDGTPLGTDVGTLPQFQRAAVIREAFFPPGAAVPTARLEFKPVEMDSALREFVLDVDGQIVRYAHGPQIPATVSWPGPRGSGVVRVMAQPAGSTGMVNDGPWALHRLMERVQLQPGNGPEKFRAQFDIDGRKAVFDVTAGSVRHPFRLPELRAFSCPQGL